jgi:hypothetical protein
MITVLRGLPSWLMATALACTPTPARPPAPAHRVEPVAGAAKMAPEAGAERSNGATIYEEPAPSPKRAPTLGPFAVTDLPASKYQLLMAVDAALRQGDPKLLGSVVMDGASAGARCPSDAGTSTRVRRQRVEGAEKYATCLGLGDWSTASRLGLDYGSRVGDAAESCDLGKHQVAHLFYALDEEVVRVSVRAVTFEGSHAIILPVKCSLPYTLDATGTKVRLPIAEWTRQYPTVDAKCPGLPWPAAWDLPVTCPK